MQNLNRSESIMDHRRNETFFIVVAPGLEEVCASELSKLHIGGLVLEKGGLLCQGRLKELYQMNLCLRTASRILVRFAEFPCKAFPDLYQKAVRLPWGRFVKPETPVHFQVSCKQSRLRHTARIAETLESAIHRALGRKINPEESPSQAIYVRIIDNQVTLSIDSSGELLHRRGYRQVQTEAPLRETLAAAILLLLDWTGDCPLADPFCGSGTFLIEAAQIARNDPGGLNRRFAFMNWPGYRPGLWAMLRQSALKQHTELQHPITGADIDPSAVAVARQNCRSNHISDWVNIRHLALEDQPVQTGPGLVISNPPYGKRLSLDKPPKVFYDVLGKHLVRAYPGWRIALLCPSKALIRATGLPFQPIASFDNGGVPVSLYLYNP
jgi:putative N6-adenine-specific DNA methylase